tara:strand:+ start:5186 stop:6445 length:1260 start_codon:yes stop_codon:yes gene_type:complete
MVKLAILGGTPVITKPFPTYISVGEKERTALLEVIDSNCLSGFYGSWEDGFLGGSKVLEFEAAWSSYFGTKYSVSVNSNTSGLLAAMGAIGLSPGDEVIVPATTMSATAVTPLFYGGIPVFADIDCDTFCLDVESVLSNITEKTKAIIAVNLFGQAAPLKQLRQIADAKGIYLIEDNAQAPCATENDEYCGTIGHIGVFSLNYHKHIHTGEGGVCTTNDDNLAQRLQLIRNHAEAVVGPAQVKDLSNMIGLNLRLTEMSAAVGLVQLSDIDKHMEKRNSFARKLTEGLSDLLGIQVPIVREGCHHVYYVWALKYDEDILGVPRNKFIDALLAEGFPCSYGYVPPLYRLPVFSKRIAFGQDSYPFNLTDRTYYDGMCPNAERLHEELLIDVEICAHDVSESDVDLIIQAFLKVYENRSNL